MAGKKVFVDEAKARSIASDYIRDHKMQAVVSSVEPKFFGLAHYFTIMITCEGKKPKKYFVLQSGAIVPSIW